MPSAGTSSARARNSSAPRALIYEPALLHQAHAFVGELVNLSAAIGAGIGALLLRPRDVAVRLAREEREAVDEVIETAAGQGLEIVGRQVAIARERQENALDVALGDDRDFGPAAASSTGASSQRELRVRKFCARIVSTLLGVRSTAG